MDEFPVSHTLEFTADERLIAAATKRFWLQFLGWRSPAIWLGGTIALSLVTLQAHRFWADWTVVVFFLFLPAIWINGYFAFLRRSRRQLNRMQNRQIHYIFTEDTVSNTSDLGKAEVPWRTFQRLCRFPDVWLLFYATNTYLYFPVSEMDEATKAFIVAQAGRHGATVS